VNCKISLNSERKKFCTKSCAAIFNNLHRSKESRIKQKNTLQLTLKDKWPTISDEKITYKNKCKFKFRPYHFENVKGFDLLNKYGLWHPIKNPTGVSRDHIISREFGWRNKINPDVISHPANCQWLLQSENASKGSESWMLLAELLERIDKWETNHLITTSLAITKVKAPSKPVYKWTLKNIITNVIEETTCITKWSKSKGLAKSRIYQSGCEWKILNKIKI